MNYECAQEVGVLHYTILERLAKEKHSNLLGPFILYKENEGLWSQVSQSQYLIFFVNYESVRLESIDRDKCSSL